MKNLLFSTCMLFFITSFLTCHPNDDHHLTQINSTDTFSRFIPLDTANKMLGSYLNSIHYEQNDTDLQSLTINVHQLRRYIDSIPGSDSITDIKLMFAHTLSYANSSQANQYAGYKSGALTIIVAACSENGYYIYYPGNMVLDYTRPCPPECPPGNAASPFLITPSINK